MKDLLCARCLMLNENGMAPRVYALLDNEELPVDLGAVPLIEAHARGAVLRSGLGPIPMEAVTMVSGDGALLVASPSWLAGHATTWRTTATRRMAPRHLR